MYQNRSLARGFNVLECIRRSARPLRMVEIANKVGLHTATTFRLLSVLGEMGYVRRDNKDRYHLDYGLYRLADAERRSLLFRETARPVLASLARELGETIQLGELQGTEIVIHERIFGRAEDRDAREAFRSYPTAAHATALGKVLLAYRGDKPFQELYAGKALHRFTKNTITVPASLQKDFAYMRRKRACCDFEEAMDGYNSHASPVWDREGNVICAISISGWLGNINSNTLPRIVPRLRAAASELGRQLAPKVSDRGTLGNSRSK
jgi:DNA-binding IclR family transcriptional regulator